MEGEGLVVGRSEAFLSLPLKTLSRQIESKFWKHLYQSCTWAVSNALGIRKKDGRWRDSIEPLIWF